MVSMFYTQQLNLNLTVEALRMSYGVAISTFKSHNIYSNTLPEIREGLVLAVKLIDWIVCRRRAVP